MKEPGLKTNNNRRWIIVEKIIGIVLLLWSVAVLYSVLSVVTNMNNYNHVLPGKPTFTKSLLNNHLTIIISVLCLFGSCMLLYKDKNGWMLCVVTSLLFGIILFISARTKTNNEALPFARYYKSYGITALLLLILFFLLLTKPIRNRFKPTTKTWLWAIGLSILLITDLIFY